MYKIAVIPGDGTGPEVTAEAVKVLKTAADKFGFNVALPDFALEIVKAGGLLEHIKKKMITRRR